MAPKKATVAPKKKAEQASSSRVPTKSRARTAKAEASGTSSEEVSSSEDSSSPSPVTSRTKKGTVKGTAKGAVKETVVNEPTSTKKSKAVASSSAVTKTKKRMVVSGDDIDVNDVFAPPVNVDGESSSLEGEQVPAKSVVTPNRQGTRSVDGGGSSSRTPEKAAITLFEAGTDKGYVFKEIIEGLHKDKFTKAMMRIHEGGIHIRQINEEHSIFYDIVLERHAYSFFIMAAMAKSSSKRFSEDSSSSSSTGYSLQINIKDLKTVIKAVKKKDHGRLELISNQTGGLAELNYKIIPSNQSGNIHIETIRIDFKIADIEMENKYRVNMPLPELSEDGQELYSHPVVITKTDFAKIKKYTSIKKSTPITIQMAKHGIRFICGKADITIGDMNVSDDEEMYSEVFYSNTFASSLSFSSMSPDIRFYAPLIPDNPLKVEFSADKLGKIRLYIKTAAMIKADNQQEPTE